MGLPPVAHVITALSEVVSRVIAVEVGGFITDRQSNRPGARLHGGVSQKAVGKREGSIVLQLDT
jgi:hypothetical protein